MCKKAIISSRQNWDKLTYKWLSLVKSNQNSSKFLYFFFTQYFKCGTVSGLQLESRIANHTNHLSTNSLAFARKADCTAYDVRYSCRALSGTAVLISANVMPNLLIYLQSQPGLLLMPVNFLANHCVLCLKDTSYSKCLNSEKVNRNCLPTKHDDTTPWVPQCTAFTDKQTDRRQYHTKRSNLCVERSARKL